jgi:formylglycine-generating enzyme required for sulfatase activity
MHGHVWEWVEDCWNGSHVGNPADGSARTRSCTDRNNRVLRGGSWGLDPRDLRSADRSWNRPGGRVGRIGFRVGRFVSR